MINALFDALQVSGIRRRLQYRLAESENRQGIDGTQERPDEPLSRSLFKRQIVPRAQAGVNGQRDRKRQRGFFVEHGNYLIVPIFLQPEVLLFQAGNGRSVTVRNGDVNINQFDIDFEGGVRASLSGGLLGWSGRLLGRRENAD